VKDLEASVLKLTRELAEASAQADAESLTVRPPPPTKAPHRGFPYPLLEKDPDVADWLCVQVERLRAELVRVNCLLAETTGRARSMGVEVSSPPLTEVSHPGYLRSA
jgi:hypothetical protein